MNSGLNRNANEELQQLFLNHSNDVLEMVVAIRHKVKIFLPPLVSLQDCYRFLQLIQKKKLYLQQIEPKYHIFITSISIALEGKTILYTVICLFDRKKYFGLYNKTEFFCSNPNISFIQHWFSLQVCFSLILLLTTALFFWLSMTGSNGDSKILDIC